MKTRRSKRRCGAQRAASSCSDPGLGPASPDPGLPTYSPWLNPIEMLWRHFRREVTHCELLDSIETSLDATRDFLDRYDRKPGSVRSIIGAHTT